MKLQIFLSTLTVGLCLAIIYSLRKRPGEVVIAPMAIEFEDIEDLQDLQGPADFGLIPPDMAMG